MPWARKRSTHRRAALLGLVAPIAAGAVVWRLMSVAPEVARSGAAGFVIGALFIIQRRRPDTGLYSAGVAVAMLGLLGLHAGDITVHGQLALWLSFAAIAAVVTYLASRLKDQRVIVGARAARIVLGETAAVQLSQLIPQRIRLVGDSSDRPPGRTAAVVAALMPATGALLIWQLADGSPGLLRMAAAATIFALFAYGVRRKPGWVTYGAATIAVLMPLSAVSSAPLPREAVAVQWLTFAGVVGVVIYLLARLREQTQRLAQLDDLKARFVALTNHELRTPVAVLQSALETLLDDLRGQLTPQQEEFLRAAWASSDDLASRVDLLTHMEDLQRSESGPDEHRAPFGRLVDRAATEARHEAVPRGIEVSVDVEAGAGRTLVPAGETEIILTQIIDNAIKFSPDGGNVLIRLRLDGDELVCDVVDQGPGIPREQRRAIFESFYQPGDLFRRTVDGMGIGLSVARMAAERLGARIEVRSREGLGSCFTVRVPSAAQPVSSVALASVGAHGGIR